MSIGQFDASSNSSNTGVAASLEDMQLTGHVALTRIKDLHRSVPKRFRHFWQVPSHVPKLRGLPAASAARYCAGTHLTPIGCAFTGRWRRRTRNRCVRLCRQFSPSRLLSCPLFRSAGWQSLRPGRVQTRPTENGKQWMTVPCGPEPNDRSWTSGLARPTTGKGPKVTA
jgi:hypothetical protein